MNTFYALQLNAVTMRFGGLTAVNSFSMNVVAGSISGLIGPNGAGKTTVFNMISGFYTPTSGSITFNDASISGLPPHRICKKGLARTFQNIRLFPTQTVLQNVMVGAHLRQKYWWWLSGLLGEEKKTRHTCMELLNRLGLADSASLPAKSLPYGDQRRLEIARALATCPSLLLLDEPAAGMNPQESGELMDLIKSIRNDFNLTILLIEHDMKVVMGSCEHIWVLEYGTCIAQGKPEEIRNNTKVIEAYLGKEYLYHARD